MMIEERWRVLGGLLRSPPATALARCRVLDLGTGGGGELEHLVGLGADPRNCCGVDLLPERVDEARRRLPGIEFRVGDAGSLDFPDRCFDLVLISTVLSSVLDPATRVRIAAEVSRIVAGGGAIVWYDMRHRSPWNRKVRPVSRAEIRRLFPGFRPRLRTTTLLPPLARRLGPATPVLYRLLAALPPLRSHLAGLLVKEPKAPG